MDILMLADYRGSWPYVPELTRQLRAEHMRVDILDIGDLSLMTDNESRPLMARHFGFLLRIPGIGLLMRICALKSFFKKNTREYDILNLHFVVHFYIFFLREFKKTAKRTVASVWGSDFYRIPNSLRRIEAGIFDHADAITFINPKTREDFIRYHGKYSEKSRIARFGIGSLDLIKRIRSEETKEQAREVLGIPAGSFVIVCGYNASPAQQHERIIESLAGTKDSLPEDTFIVLPMTYPADGKYVEHVKRSVEASGFGHKLFTTMMSDEDVARLRLAGDLVLNMQTTDQLSASIQEHLFAGAVVVVGEWLPYGVYDDMGIFMLKARDFEHLKPVVSDCVAGYQVTAEKCRGNTDKIYKFSCWQGNIKLWTGLYEEMLRVGHQQ